MREPIESCPRCEGEGVVAGPRVCRMCGGAGRVIRGRMMKVTRDLAAPLTTSARSMLDELAAAESL